MFSQTEWEYIGLSGEYIWDIEIDGNGNIYVAVEQGPIYKSSDNGVTWELKNNGFSSAFGEEIAIYNNQIYVTTNTGLYKSTNGGDNWFRIAQSIPFLDFDKVSVIPNGYIFVSVFNLGTGGVFRSTDAGVTWEATSFTGFGALDFGINKNGVMFFCDATLSYHGIYRSFDLGMIWEMLSPQMGTDALEYLNDGSILAGSEGNALGTIPAGIYKSTNNGDTWFNTNTFGDLNGFPDFVLDTNDDIYVSVIGMETGVYISTDSGVSWEYKGLSDVNGVSCLAIDSSGYVYAGTGSNGIFRMPGRTTPVELISFSAIVNERDVELSWITATELNNSGFEILRFAQNDNNGWNKVGFIPGHGTTSESTAYYYVDKNLSTGSYNYRIKQIDYDGTYQYYNLNETIEISNQLSFSLEQNYPNPFNPSTIIPYRLKERGHVRLSIYDLKGELVRVLVNEWQEKGYYEIMFHPNSQERSRANSFEVPMGKTYSHMSSGMYIYSIQVIDERNIPVFTDSGKMILLK